jgi:glycosyltransferase involved in cell wall biosynthesis
VSEEIKPKLSVAMIVKDESRCLARCLQSIKGIADEIIIVDTGSTDETVGIARDYGAHVVSFEWVDNFAAARNFALDQSGGDWILALDADEWVSEGLAGEIPIFLREQMAVGRVKVVSDFRRNHQTFRSQCFLSRLFPRGAHYEGRIHEQLVSPLPRINLRGELWHDGYLEVLQKTARNMRLLTLELDRDPDNVYYLYQLGIEHNSIGRPDKAFGCFQDAYLRMKVDDALAPNITVDFIYTITDVKQFVLGLEVVAKAETYLLDFPDFFLARGLFFMHLVRSNPAKYVSELPKIEESFLRCLKLGEDERRRSVFGSGSYLASYNLGLYYQLFGNIPGARKYYGLSAAQGYAPAAALLKKLDVEGRK